MTLGTPDGLEPITSDHIVEHICLSCGEAGAHWISPRLNEDGTLTLGRYACEVNE